MKRMLICALLVAAPGMAHDGAPPATAASPVAVDPERHALATATVDFIWPVGTYARMMDGSMNQMVDELMASMFDMKMGDMVAGMAVGPDGKPLDPVVAESTIREAMAKADPHFEERMRIMNRVTMEAMGPVMTRIEPSVRGGLALALARKLNAAQLREVNAFFATPAGRVYASESMMLWVDPEVTAAMSGAVPELFREMPAIMNKVRAATAHLPPPPRRVDDRGEPPAAEPEGRHH